LRRRLPNATQGVAVSVGVTVDGVVVTGTVSVGAGVSGVTGGVSVVTTGVFVGVTGVSGGTVVAGSVSVGVTVVGTGVVGVGVGWMTGRINCRNTNRHSRSNSVTSSTSSRTRKTLDVFLQRSLKELMDYTSLPATWQNRPAPYGAACV
jgi:hypothetical protein